MFIQNYFRIITNFNNNNTNTNTNTNNNINKNTNNWTNRICMLGCKNDNSYNNYIIINISQYNITEAICVLCTYNVIDEDGIIIVDANCGHFICNKCNNLKNLLTLNSYNKSICIYCLSGICSYCNTNINGNFYFFPNKNINICYLCYQNLYIYLNTISNNENNNDDGDDEDTDNDNILHNYYMKLFYCCLKKNNYRIQNSNT